MKNIKIDFKLELTDLLIGLFFVLGASTIIMFVWSNINFVEEQECINYYINTGYILEECSNYENLKK